MMIWRADVVASAGFTCRLHIEAADEQVPQKLRTVRELFDGADAVDPRPSASSAAVASIRVDAMSCRAEARGAEEARLRLRRLSARGANCAEQRFDRRAALDRQGAPLPRARAAPRNAVSASAPGRR